MWTCIKIIKVRLTFAKCRYLVRYDQMQPPIPRPYGSRDDVLINNAEDANGVLSNMTRTPVTVGGLTYPSPEHFFQVSLRDMGPCACVRVLT